jgi:hypothetical protein
MVSGQFEIAWLGQDGCGGLAAWLTGACVQLRLVLPTPADIDVKDLLCLPPIPPAIPPADGHVGEAASSSPLRNCGRGYNMSTSSRSRISPVAEVADGRDGGIQHVDVETTRS